MYYKNVKFTDLEAKILAKLTTGEIVEVYTALQTTGNYEEWKEDRLYDQDINENEIELLYPDEWEFVDKNRQNEYDENIKVEEIVKIIDVEWKVDIDSMIDY